MFNPKKEVYTALKSLGYPVMQGSQAVIAETPSVQGNGVNLDLDNDITHQEVIIGVDIWADDSITASDILAKVEAKMRGIFYRMTNSLDVPNPDPSLFHTACSFRATKLRT